MKSPPELRQELTVLLKSSGANQQAMFTMVASGDLVKDFCLFTDLQSGKKSDDPSDPAAKDSPATPDKDGRYYHTIRDITYTTFKQFIQNAPVERFYNMSDADRMLCVQWYINAGKITNNAIINTFLSYCIWASGNCNSERNYYKVWYGKGIAADVNSDHTYSILDRITDIRLYRLSELTQYPLYGKGWQRGVLNLWKLLLQYEAQERH